MIIKECKSHTGDCPCLYCEKLIDCGPCLGNDEQFETAMAELEKVGAALCQK